MIFPINFLPYSNPQDDWTCSEWQQHYIALEQANGKPAAVAKWTQDFERASMFSSVKNSCRYNSAFVNFMASKGIDVRSFTSSIIMSILGTAVETTDALAEGVTTTTSNVANTATNATKAAAATGKTLAIALPLTLIAVIGGGLWYLNTNAKNITNTIKSKTA